MKKIFLLFLMVISLVGLSACDQTVDTGVTDTTDDTDVSGDADVIAPAFADTKDGMLLPIEHLKGETYDFLDGVVARDNKTATADVVIEVTDYAGYNKDTVGVYEIEYTATDEADNSTSIKRSVEVLETITKEFLAMRINDSYAPMVYNDDTALGWIASNDAQLMARTSSSIQVMDSDFYLAQTTEHATDWATNGGQPFLPWAGIAFIFDEEFNLVYGRFSADWTTANTYEYINGELSNASADDKWYTNAQSTETPGGVLAGIDTKVTELLADAKGYVVFATTADTQDGRIMLLQNLFSTEFGGSTLGTPDCDYANLDVEINIDYSVDIQKPDAMNAPVVTIDQHVLTVTSDNTANVEQYLVTFSAEGQETVTKTLTTSSNSIELYNVINEEDTLLVKDVEYTITVQAFTNNVYEASDSLVSDELAYTFTDITVLTAPVLTVEGNNISWTLDSNAASYEIYARAGSATTLLDTVTDSSFAFGGKLSYAGTVALYVVAIAVDGTPYLNSVYTTAIEVTIDQEETLKFTSGDITVDVLEVPAAEYFVRRNSSYTSDVTGFAGSKDNGVFLITNINDITLDTWGDLTVTEAYGVVILMDSENNIKFVRNIMANEWLATSEVANGWAASSIYTSNAAQLAGISNYLEEGDQLLIFKNGNVISYENAGVEASVDARQLGAYLFVVSGSTVDEILWKGDVSTFKNCKDIVFTIA